MAKRKPKSEPVSEPICFDLQELYIDPAKVVAVGDVLHPFSVPCAMATRLPGSILTFDVTEAYPKRDGYSAGERSVVLTLTGQCLDRLFEGLVFRLLPEEAVLKVAEASE